MVKHTQYNEIAILFKKEIIQKQGTAIKYLRPIKATLGYYDDDEELFVDIDDNPHQHILIDSPGLSYGKRLMLTELFEFYPNTTLDDAISEYLKSIEDKEFYYQDETETSKKVIEFDKTTKEQKEFQDGDSYYINCKYNEQQDIEEYENMFERQESPMIKTFNSDSLTKIETYEELYQEICKTVIGQDEAVLTIVTTLWDNYTPESKKTKNIFINGPSGTGKTQTCKIIADTLKVPFLNLDCNDYTAAGFVGKDVNSIVTELYEKAGYNLELAQKGIIFLDEVDKIASTDTKDKITTTDVQNLLLKMIEGKEFVVESKSSDEKILNTSKNTFIVAGAFTNIEQVEKRELGFGSNLNKTTYENLSRTNFKNYGLQTEFLGRFDVHTSFKALDKDTLSKILSISLNSPLLREKELLQHQNINLEYPETIIDIIAEYAYNLNKEVNQGARTLSQIVTEMIRHAKGEILLGKYRQGYNTIHLTEESVTNPKKYILKKQ